MREFIFVANKAVLSDIPLLSRVLNAAFFLSHDIRRDVVLRILIQDTWVLVTFLGAKLRHVHVDEQSVSGVLRKTVRAAASPPARPLSVHSGVLVERLNRAKLPVSEKCYLASSKGAWLPSVIDSCAYMCFVLSEGLSADYEREMPLVRVTAFPKPVDTTLVILNIELDRICSSKIA